ncbi:MAG: FAD-dependent oxidoreductase [Pirellulales bacterium]
MPQTWGVDGPKMEEIKTQFLFEPHAAEAVFDEMAREAEVAVIYGERLDLNGGVVKQGPRITSIRMEKRSHVRRQGLH